MAKETTIQKALGAVSRLLQTRSRPRTREEFRAMFDLFKKVLDSNNKALETITDMAEKLGGDYLFDIVYVRNAYEHLKKDLGYSLRKFGELTAGRYSPLGEVYGQIDSVIGNVLSDQPEQPGPFVLSLKDVSWRDIQSVGGKVGQLADVSSSLGLRVPAGFVITTAAYDDFVAFNGAEDVIGRFREGQAGESDLAEMQELLLHGKMPPALGREIRRAVEGLRKHAGGSLAAVRSSAGEEDGEHSFAGQFRTVLGVPLIPDEVERAYRKVIASLFTGKATAYQQQTGHTIGSMKMAVGCMLMVDAVASGVAYSSSPDGDAGTAVISAAWGLGESIVEAGTGADVYYVRKDEPSRPVRSSIGKKESAVVLSAKGGTAEQPVSSEDRDRPCLSEEQISALTAQAVKIERFFGTPRDIEWAVDRQGVIWILQARPLKQQRRNTASPSATGGADYPVLAKGDGEVVQQGVAAGRIFVANQPSDVLSMPRGAVLVAKHDSSLFITRMASIAAIITERGSATSHMAALCRELRIPTIVNMTGARQLLKQGQEVTVFAGDEGPVLYRGRVRSVLETAGHNSREMESLAEFRKKRYILRYISPLHLVDPLMEEFTPENCRTLHDILRFMHEKSVAELVKTARSGNSSLKKRAGIVPLDLPVPAGILVLDIGGGLPDQFRGKAAQPDDITSIPFRAILRGMLQPGAWHDDPVSFNAGDLISSMIRMPDITTVTGSTAAYNLAVLSRDYVNMSIRFGYHFNMLDCYCSEKARNNHIYFRFAGGATDLAKRSRRLDLLERILSHYGFGVKIKGDLLIARLAGIGRDEMEQVLDGTGRLIAFARQLDAVLRDDGDIARFADNFMRGVLSVSGGDRDLKTAGMP